MAIITSGATTDQLTIDPTSKAARATMYDSQGRELTSNGKAMFSCANTFTPGPTPNDFVTITGSASKTIRVLSMKINTTNATAAGSCLYVLTKRSTLDTGGAFIPTPGVPFDSTQAAATANVGHWTASPGTLGNRVGDIHIQRVAVPVAVPTSWATLTDNADTEMIPKIDEYGLMGATKLLTLRGASEQLAISFNNAVVGVGQTHTFEVVWTEE